MAEERGSKKASGNGRARPSARARSGKAAETTQPAATKATASARGAAARKPAKKTVTKKAAKPAGAPKQASAAKPAARRPVAKARKPASVPPPGVRVEPEELETVASVPVPRHAETNGARPVDERLQDIERNLDRLLSDAETGEDDPQARRRAAEALAQIAARLSPGEPRENPEESLFGTARSLLSTDYYFRQWGRVAMRNRSEEVDDFGLDPAYERRFLPLFELLYRKWFRVQTEGLDRVPNDGRALLVSNHSGTVPWDGVMLKMAMHLEHPRGALRWLAEDFVFHMPFLGAFMNRIGAVRACQENAERLLCRDELVAVFPEGIKGIGKLFRQRYQLQRFGRGGYIKLALRTRTPIIPTAIVGAEETNPLLFKVTHLTKGIGLPYVPVTPTFPLLGPLGLVPAPTRWRILFGEPIELDEHGPEAAEDAVLVNRLNERVRNTIQHMLDHALAQRTSVFWG